MRIRILSLRAAAVGVVALVALAGAATARPPFGGALHGPPGDDHPERFLERYAERLGIDDATREAIEQEFEASHEQAEPLREALDDAHRALREMLREPDPDREAVMSQAETIGALDTQLRKLRLGTLLEVRALLSEEQRAEMVAIHEERKQARLEPLREDCGADWETLCPDTDDPRALFGCMHEHRDELSESCRDALGRAHHRGHHRGCGAPDASCPGPPAD